MYFLETNTVTPVVNTPEAEHGSSSSSRSPVESPASPVPASPVIDADLARMEALLDNWCLDLKRNVLVRNGLCCTMYKCIVRNPCGFLIQYLHVHRSMPPCPGSVLWTWGHVHAVGICTRKVYFPFSLDGTLTY